MLVIDNGWVYAKAPTYSEAVSLIKEFYDKHQGLIRKPSGPHDWKIYQEDCRRSVRPTHDGQFVVRIYCTLAE